MGAVAIMIGIKDISHHAFRWRTVLNEPPSGFGIFSWTFYLFALICVYTITSTVKISGTVRHKMLLEFHTDIFVS